MGCCLSARLWKIRARFSGNRWDIVWDDDQSGDVYQVEQAVVDVTHESGGSVFGYLRGVHGLDFDAVRSASKPLLWSLGVPGDLRDRGMRRVRLMPDGKIERT